MTTASQIQDTVLQRKGRCQDAKNRDQIVGQLSETLATVKGVAHATLLWQQLAGHGRAGCLSLTNDTEVLLIPASGPIMGAMWGGVHP